MPRPGSTSNFFQPSFKLRAKTRDGARVRKKYHAPATPCDRLLESAAISDAVKSSLREQFAGLDPVRLLRDIRAAQQTLSTIAERGPRVTGSETSESTDVSAYVQSLAIAWKAGEVRPTHRPKATKTRWWRTKADPFEHAWPVVEGWLIAEPTVTAKDLMMRLAEKAPDAYASKA